MADSLDDFFAKKDKKRKNKTQSAALSASALVRELEEGSKQSEYSARRDGKTSAAMEILGLDTNDNDWKDFEEVEKRDYTGLKVKEMSIQDQDEEQRRLTEQSEQVTETIPWRSKEDTVAALLSAKIDSNQLANDAMHQSESAKEATSLETTAPPATATTTDLKSSQSDDKDSDANKEAPATTQPNDKKPGPAKDEPKQGDKDATSNSTADGPKKEGDTEPPVTAKKVYVPPMQRLEKEQTTLQPIKGGLLKASGSRRVAQINLDSKQEFPGLG